MSARLIAATALVLACAGGGAADAHHSYAAFDGAKTTSLSGVVTNWEWTNPHSYLYLIVGSAAANETWMIESASPALLARIPGMNRNVVKAGDMVSVKLHPRRDGARVGSLMSLTLPDGKVINLAPPPRPESP